ncbi:hypothetical protein ACFORO_19230 [Amycolatopsis halotolerans]|uniref:DUF2975 domain-containing protein n=1 Tax=Amycolatopsis halotolerans TaxID=330083 RepID=A0ABV7QJ20_9PSEU
MRTTVRTLKFAAIWLFVAGVALLGLGFLAEITEPPNGGANIGAGAAFTFGMGCTGLGLVLGVVAAVDWLRVPKGERGPAAPLLPWEHRLRRLAAAAVVLIAAAAVVLSWAALIFANGHAGSGSRDSYPVFLVGLSLAGLGLLAGIPYAVFWLSWRRTAARLRLSGRA